MKVVVDTPTNNKHSVTTKMKTDDSGRVSKVTIIVKRHRHPRNNSSNSNSNSNSNANGSSNIADGEQQQVQPEQPREKEATSSEIWRQVDRALDAYAEERGRLLAANVEEDSASFNLNAEMAGLAALL